MNLRIFLTTLLWLALPFSPSAQRRSRFTSDNPQYASRHQLSLGIASGLNGFIPLNFSQAVGASLALQASAGITFRSPLYIFQQEFYHDGRHSTLHPSATDEIGQPFDLEDNYRLGEYRKAKPGFMLGAALKYFLSDHSMNGSYLGIVSQFRRYNTVANRVRDGVPAYYSPDTYLPDNPIREHGSMIDLALTCGKTKLFTGEAGGVLLELCAQFGVSYQRYHMQDLGVRLMQTTSQGAEATLIDGVQDYAVLRPYFNLDLRLGGWAAGGNSILKRYA